MILGFHTQFHCNNFLETVDRFWKAVSTASRTFRCLRRGEVHVVRPYPISIDWPPAALAKKRTSCPPTCVRETARSAAPGTASASGSNGSTTPRASSNACRPSIGSWTSSRVGGPASSSCRSRPRRAAHDLQVPDLRGLNEERSPTRSMRATAGEATAIILFVEITTREVFASFARPTSASSAACTTA